nr:hypothetical protein [Clostridia bacterium]
NRQDSEETVSDTYLKAWNAIPPQRPSVFKLFLARITRNLALSRWREKTADKRGGGTMELVMHELQDCIAVTASANVFIGNFDGTEVESKSGVLTEHYIIIEVVGLVSAVARLIFTRIVGVILGAGCGGKHHSRGKCET